MTCHTLETAHPHVSTELRQEVEQEVRRELMQVVTKEVESTRATMDRAIAVRTVCILSPLFSDGFVSFLRIATGPARRGRTAHHRDRAAPVQDARRDLG